MRWAVAVVLLMGCDKVFLPEERDVCAGQAGPNNTGLFQYCAATDPVFERSLLSQISTDDDCDALVIDDLEELCVVTAVKLTIGAGVKAVGARPLVLFATETIVVGGALSVTSRIGEPPAAGANAKMCSQLAPVAAPDAPGDGGGGGPGGTLEQGGANGGAGAGSTAGGVALTPRPVGTIRGGCPGGRGGAGGAPTSAAAPPGAGGGVMYLVAGESITVAGTLEASGAGGGGSAGIGGGGGPGGSGGGSGGLIALDAPTITLAAEARLVANGGAGGGGGGSFAGANATGGTTADAAADFPFATSGGRGGGATANGGRGGAGGDAMAVSKPGEGGSSGTGGGGGGGAAGVIRVYTTNLVDHDAQVSPPY